jgi:hypothetical protein
MWPGRLTAFWFCAWPLLATHLSGKLGQQAACGCGPCSSVHSTARHNAPHVHEHRSSITCVAPATPPGCKCGGVVLPPPQAAVADSGPKLLNGSQPVRLHRGVHQAECSSDMVCWGSQCKPLVCGCDQLLGRESTGEKDLQLGRTQASNSRFPQACRGCGCFGWHVSQGLAHNTGLQAMAAAGWLEGLTETVPSRQKVVCIKGWLGAFQSAGSTSCVAWRYPAQSWVLAVAALSHRHWQGLASPSSGGCVVCACNVHT